ncbi:MAG: DM13 domain-containing protein [Gemmatimonadales bacterium]
MIGKLTRFSGGQSYDLPATADLGKYTHLVLWCRKYSVNMAEPTLTSPGSKKMDGMMQDEGATMEEKDQMDNQPASKPN